MGASDSQPLSARSQDISGPLEIPGLSSLDGYSQWWGSSIPGLGEAEKTSDTGGAGVSAAAVQEAFALVEEAPGPRMAVQPMELDFGRETSHAASANHESAGSSVQEDINAEEADEDEDDEEDVDQEEFVMSRLVGRDGYLLPYATNSFHMHQEAQLHHLHHQDPDLEANRETGYKDNENIFFRAPRECPGWLPGGRFLGHDDAKEAIEDLQAREQNKARKARAHVRKQFAADLKQQHERRKKFGAGRMMEEFDTKVHYMRTERALAEESQLDLDTRGVTAPTREAAMHESVVKLKVDTDRFSKRNAKLKDAERELLHSRLMAINEVRQQINTENLYIAEPLQHAGHPR